MDPANDGGVSSPPGPLQPAARSASRILISFAVAAMASVGLVALTACGTSHQAIAPPARTMPATEISAAESYLKNAHFATPSDYVGAEGADTVVDIQPGSPVTSIGQILVADNVIASSEAFRRIAADDPRIADIQPGNYRLRTHMSAAAALAALLDPSNRIGGGS